MTIDIDAAWKLLPFSDPDQVGDVTVQFDPSPQWKVLASVAMWWRALTPESPMKDVAAAMKAFAGQHPDVIRKIESACLDDGPALNAVFTDIIATVEQDPVGGRLIQ